MVKYMLHHGHLAIFKVLIAMQILYIFKYNDASIKTDTCKSPIGGYFGIENRYIIQAFPISYPKNRKAYNYTIPLIMVSGFIEYDIFNITGSEIYMWNGASSSNGIYKDYDNPITCKYWYIDM